METVLAQQAAARDAYTVQELKHNRQTVLESAGHREVRPKCCPLVPVSVV
jgi:hypothetical protein